MSSEGCYLDSVSAIKKNTFMTYVVQGKYVHTMYKWLCVCNCVGNILHRTYEHDQQSTIVCIRGGQYLGYIVKPRYPDETIPVSPKIFWK